MCVCVCVCVCVRVCVCVCNVCVCVGGDSPGRLSGCPMSCVHWWDKREDGYGEVGGWAARGGGDTRTSV